MMFANGPGCVPPNPRFEKPSMQTWKVVQIVLFAMGGLCGSFCLQMGGAAPLQPALC